MPPTSCPISTLIMKRAATDRHRGSLFGDADDSERRSLRFISMEEKSLPELYPQLLQHLQLLLPLDPLRDHARLDLVRELPEGLQEALLDAALVDVVHEAGVELEEVGLD